MGNMENMEMVRKTVARACMQCGANALGPLCPRCLIAFRVRRVSRPDWDADNAGQEGPAGDDLPGASSGGSPVRPGRIAEHWLQPSDYQAADLRIRVRRFRDAHAGEGDANE